MPDHYTLYGSYASYYTAKTRSYLRKKGIAFVERLPSDPLFRETIRPTSGSHRIPQLLTPNGEVIQDTVTIQDTLELKFEELPAIPSSPNQKIFVHLMELFASEGLLQLAWQHRWLFPDNHEFVIKDFGRSFRPQGTDEELDKYGHLIADRMMSYGLPETNEAVQTQLEQSYIGLLNLVEQHLIEHPYFLGGHPSAADYAIMGALHAHMGRDPVGLQTMQHNAPRTFRWVENMLLPEIQAPEFYDRDIKYPALDEVAQTSLAILRYIATHYGQPLIASVLAFNLHVAATEPTPNQTVDKDADQPNLPPVDITYDGSNIRAQANVYHVWLAQRSQSAFATLPSDQRAHIHQLLDNKLLSDLLDAPMGRTLLRKDNRFYYA